MDDGVYLFKKIKINKELIEEIFSFNPTRLEQTNGETIATYALALSQYLIYFQSQVNNTKALIKGKKRILDDSISLNLDEQILKKYKTKKDAASFIVNTVHDCTMMQEDLDKLQKELILVEGMDKTISELIATFKRELTRRENELYAVRQERQGR